MFTKSDIALPDDVAALAHAHPGAVAVSAEAGDRDRRAARRASAIVCGRSNPIVELEVPYDRGDVLAALHRDGEVLVEVHEEGGTRVRARLPRRDVGRYVEFVVVH